MPRNAAAARVAAGGVGHDCRPDRQSGAVRGTARMQNLLGTCLAIGILVGGFAITGDLGRLAARCMRVIGATDVPGVAAPISTPARPAPSGIDFLPPPPVVAATPRRGAGVERIDLAATRPGQRILVWLDAAAEPLPVDVVDPATAAVILHDGPPRRATIAGGGIVRGEALRVVGLGLAHAGAATPESLGRVTSIDAGR